MITPEAHQVDFDAEADELARHPKEEYIDLDELTSSGDGSTGTAEDFETEEEFQSSREHAEGANSDRYARTGKLLFTIGDVVIPRGLGMWLKIHHQELRADEEDKRDLIEAFTELAEHERIEFDSPYVKLFLLLAASYGLKAIDIRQRQKSTKTTYTTASAYSGPKKENKRPTGEPEPEEAEQEDVEDDSHMRAPVVAEFRTCEGPNCAKMLKSHQRKYCSTECRVKGLNQRVEK